MFNSVGRKISSCCDSLSHYVEVGGMTSSALSILLAVFYYNSPVLAALSTLPITGCGLGYYYNRKYRELKPIEDLSQEVGLESIQVEKNAALVDEIARKELQLDQNFREEEKKEETALREIRQEDESRLKTVSHFEETIKNLHREKEDLGKENLSLKKQIEKLNGCLRELDQEMEKWEQQNKSYGAFLKETKEFVRHFEDDEKNEEESFDAIFSRLAERSKQMRGNFELVFHQLQTQNEELQKQVRELSNSVSRLDQLDQNLEEKMKQENLVEEQIKKLKQELQMLHAQLVCDTQEIQAVSGQLSSLSDLGRITDRLSALFASSSIREPLS